MTSKMIVSLLRGVCEGVDCGSQETGYVGGRCNKKPEGGVSGSAWPKNILELGLSWTPDKQAETRARGVSMPSDGKGQLEGETRAGMQQRACDINGQALVRRAALCIDDGLQPK